MQYLIIRIATPILVTVTNYLLLKIFKKQADDEKLSDIYDKIIELIIEIINANDRTIEQQKAETIRVMERTLSDNDLKLLRKKGGLDAMVKKAYREATALCSMEKDYHLLNQL